MTVEPSTISEMTSAGDELIFSYDETDPKQVKHAKKVVAGLRKKGCLVHTVEDEHVEVGGRRVATNKKKGTQITEDHIKEGEKTRVLGRKPFAGG